MPDHRRTVIFDAVLALIQSIDDFSAPGKAVRGRVSPIRQENLPAITLTWSDDDETATVRPQSSAAGADGYDRFLDVSVIVHLRATDPDPVFDALALLIEEVLGAAVTLGGIAVEMTLQSSRFFVDPETGLPLGVGRLVYRVHYTTLAADPATPALT